MRRRLRKLAPSITKSLQNFECLGSDLSFFFLSQLALGIAQRCRLGPCGAAEDIRLSADVDHRHHQRRNTGTFERLGDEGVVLGNWEDTVGRACFQGVFPRLMLGPGHRLSEQTLAIGGRKAKAVFPDIEPA